MLFTNGTALRRLGLEFRQFKFSTRAGRITNSEFISSPHLHNAGVSDGGLIFVFKLLVEYSF
jgi:hypothetical protein